MVDTKTNMLDTSSMTKADSVGLFYNLRQHIIDHYEYEWVNDKELKLDFIHTTLLTIGEYYPFQICILTYNGEWYMCDIEDITDVMWNKLEDIGLFKSYFVTNE